MTFKQIKEQRKQNLREEVAERKIEHEGLMTMKDFKTGTKNKEDNKIDPLQQYIRKFRHNASSWTQKSPKKSKNIQPTTELFGQLLVQKALENVVKSEISKGLLNKMRQIRRNLCNHYEEPTYTDSDDDHEQQGIFKVHLNE